MEIIVKMIVVFSATILFVYFFKKCAGTLSYREFNIYNVSFYYLLIFCLAGLSLIFLGYREHYLLQKVQYENTFSTTFFYGSYAIISLPIYIILFLRLYKISNFYSFYKEYSLRKVEINKKNNTFAVVSILTFLGFLALVYTFVEFGGIPIIDVLVNGGNGASLRYEISRGFSGNQYIRNILALQLIPFLSYISYIYMIRTRMVKWKKLFCILFILSLMCKTYNLEKAPVVLYLFYFCVIDELIGKKVNYKRIIKFTLMAIGLIVLTYLINGYDGDFLTIKSGPISRVLFSQIACLFLHIEAFPTIYPYLYGDSFSYILGGAGLRSGRIVMEIYNPTGVADGIAGVMNTLYIGEAYANYGLLGLLCGPIIVGFIMAIIPTFFLKQEKEPINIAIYVYICSIYCGALVGGFVDFIYSSSIILTIIISILLKLASNNGRIKFKI